MNAFGKFEHPTITAKGEERAEVALTRATTLWFNTGTLCNITCTGCYIDSSPRNDALVYLTTAEVEDYLAEARARGWPLEETGFTGGEPFMNPQILGMIEAALLAGTRVLVLTNAMRPMMRPRVQAGLSDLHRRFPGRLTARVSLDHHTAARHDDLRGAGAFDIALRGLDWLAGQGIPIDIAGRTLWGEPEPEARAAYARLFAARGLTVGSLILFPEMDAAAPVPEITTACWGILHKSPEDVMCASSRMVVRHKGSAHASVAACTLLPYDRRFDLGQSLAEAERAVRLNHPHCARFCVLGGASCSA